MSTFRTQLLQIVIQHSNLQNSNNIKSYLLLCTVPAILFLFTHSGPRVVQHSSNSFRYTVPLHSIPTMFSFGTIIAASLLALGATAAPSQEKRNNGYCLNRSQAQQIATNYGTLIASYTDALANAALSPNFVDYSESVNTLINSCPQGSAAQPLPLLSPSFTNRSAFELGQGEQAAINFNQLNIWHSCDTVIIRWETTNTANITDVKPVVGLISMETCQAPYGNEYPYLIDTVYSEFDAGAWLQNLIAAGFCPASAAEAPASTTLAAPSAATAVPTASAEPAAP